MRFQKADPWPAWCTVLGIRPDASPTDIDRAFRTRALLVHPDKGGRSEDMRALIEARTAAKEARR